MGHRLNENHEAMSNMRYCFAKTEGRGMDDFESEFELSGNDQEKIHEEALFGLAGYALTVSLIRELHRTEALSEERVARVFDVAFGTLRQLRELDRKSQKPIGADDVVDIDAFLENARHAEEWKEEGRAEAYILKAKSFVLPKD